MIGTRFSRWHILAAAAPHQIGRRLFKVWLCRCNCGTERNVLQMSLKAGTSQSCGCLNKERTSAAHTKHGLTGSKEYVIWRALRGRCNNPNYSRAADYSVRGITVCSRWDDFAVFLADMGPRPSDRHSIERVDNEKGYGPDNCIWTTPDRQMVNRRNTRFVETPEGRVPLADLAKRHGLPANTLRGRIVKGWPLEKALSEPVKPQPPYIRKGKRVG